MGSQITGVSIGHWAVFSGEDHESSESPMNGEFPAQRANYTENVSIWWRHHPKMEICGTHVRPILQEVVKKSNRKLSSKITLAKIISAAPRGKWVNIL